MPSVFEHDRAFVFHGDCLEEMRALPDESIDAIVTDPPYGLSKEPDAAEVLRHWLAGDDYVHHHKGFMGKSWDSFVPGPATWKEALRVLKPGGHLLAFFGTRTYDLGVLAIRLAGFEIRDLVAYLYGSGFPKSLDVSKAIDKAAGVEREVVGVNPNFRDPEKNAEHHARWNAMSGSGNLTVAATDAARQWSGWGTALKPAMEPICVARKPLIGTVARNVETFGTGALNIDGTRIASSGETIGPGSYSDPSKRKGAVGPDWTAVDKAKFQAAQAASVEKANALGRWPANVMLDEEAAAMLDAQSGERPGMKPARLRRGSTTGRGMGFHSADAQDAGVIGRGDSGGASRFFYTSKASKKERLLPDGTQHTHPTTKPIKLMQWLVRLVTPPDGVVLDPFCGSGTTAVAALREGFSIVAIEREEQYVGWIKQRVEAELASPAESAEDNEDDTSPDEAAETP